MMAFSPLLHSFGPFFVSCFLRFGGRCLCVQLYFFLISLWEKQQKAILVFSSFPLIVPIASFGGPLNLLFWRKLFLLHISITEHIHSRDVY